MRKIFAAICTLLLTQAVLAGQQQNPDISLARETTAAFASALKAKLVQAMQTGGPLKAIDVCNTQAPKISAAVSLEKGVEVSRVSLKNRSPENAANDWQAGVLDAFETRRLAGETPDSLNWNETVMSENGKEFRFMKAIPTGGICLQCHGQAIAAPVAEKLAELYPEDKATGYSEGDLRGAFVVIRKID